MNAVVSSQSGACTAPDRLRWIADFLDVADKAISVIACVQGFDYPAEFHRGAQQDLRAWARWLDARPELAAEMDVVRMVVGVEAAPTRHVFADQTPRAHTGIQ
jgi:hypothetical protein